MKDPHPAPLLNPWPKQPAVPALKPSEIISRIKSGKIKLAGYRKAGIYGTLHCRSGKRMKAENRVFFSSEEEAIKSGYRPCAHCLPEKYKRWKAKNSLPTKKN